jgi:hypothetical protein
MLKLQYKYKIIPILGSILVLCIIIFSLKCLFSVIFDVEQKGNYYLSSNIYTVEAYDENIKKVTDFPRGLKIEVKEKEIKQKNNIYKKVTINKKTYYINKNNLTQSKKDIIKEKEIYIRTSTILYENEEKGNIIDVLKKGDKIDVIEGQTINNDGTIKIYKIKKGDKEGYVYGKYTVLTKELSLANYKEDTIYAIHKVKGNPLKGGSPANLDYYPVSKPKFKDNIMPNQVYAWYLNSSSNIINNVDKYIKLAENTVINAFVVDIKDNMMPGYKSEVMKKYSKLIIIKLIIP